MKEQGGGTFQLLHLPGMFLLQEDQQQRTNHEAIV